MNFDDSFAKRRSVPILTRENCDQWFPLMKRWLIEEDLWSVIEGKSGSDTLDSVTSITSGIQSLGFESQKVNAKAHYWLIICIIIDDQEHTADKTSAKEVWDALSYKYKEKLQITGRQYLADFIGYRMSADTFIEKAWTHLAKLARKIAATQKDMSGLFKPERRFQALLQSLPDEYTVIRDVIDAQNKSDVEKGLQKLQEKEAQLKTTEAALWVKRGNERERTGREQNKRKISHRRKSLSSSDSDQSRRRQPQRSLKCFLCGDGHRLADCSHLSAAQKLVKKRKGKGKTKHKGADDLQILTELLKGKHKKHRAYNAKSDDSEISGDNEEDENEESEDIAALSKDIVSKISEFDWVADSDASSHMTDQLRLFSDSLVRIKRRTIKVEGGKLYVNHCGTAVIRDRHENSVKLSSVLHVSKLGVNLLSERRMCEKGLQGSFDDKGLYMHDKRGKQMIEALECEGVYIVEIIANGLDEFALLSAMQRDVSSAFPAMHSSMNLDGSMNLDHFAPHTDVIHHENEAEVDHDQLSFANDKSSKLYKLWHRRFAHLGSAKLRQLYKVITLEKPILINDSHEDVCEICALTKFINKRGHNVSDRKTSILTLIFIDICGPLSSSLDSESYFLEIVDNHSRKTWCISLKQRSDASDALRKWKLSVELHSDAKLLSVRSDNVTELKATLNGWCSSVDIAPQYTVSHMSIRNGVVERVIRITENSMRAMIKNAELLIEFWAEAAKTDAYLRNRTVTRLLIDEASTTSEEAFIGIKPSIDHVRVWRCKCYSYVDLKSLSTEGRRDKFMNRGRSGAFMEYVKNTDKQYRLWVSDLGRVIKSHAVKFAEDEKGEDMDLRLRKQTFNVLSERRSVGRPSKNNVSTNVSKSDAFMIDVPSESTDALKTIAVNLDALNSKVTPHTSDEREAHADVQIIQKVFASSMSKSAAQTFLHVVISKRKRDSEDQQLKERAFKISRAMAAWFATEEVDDDESDSDASMSWALFGADESDPPKAIRIPTSNTYKDAVQDSVWEELWKEAINAELVTLVVNETWQEEVPPKKVNIVTSKWVFKSKMHVDGSLDKLKARLIVRGFFQIHEVDYENTFASIVKFDTLRVFLAIAAMKDLELHQVDVNNAFTESFLKETIYMFPSSEVKVRFDCALRVFRSLYDLKQAARDWHDRCVTALSELGFAQCAADPCLLIHGSKGIMLLLYVDDIVIVFKSLSNIKWFKHEFQCVFKVKNLREMKKILDIQITRNRKARTLRMDQTHYLHDVLERLNMRQDKHKATDLSMNEYDALRSAELEDVRINQHEYQQAIESLMYAAIHTRSDIAFALNRLSQYLSDSAEHHEHALKKLMWYVRSTIDLGITYEVSGSMELVGYSDSDYVSDRLDRKSILAYIYMLGEGSVSWMSRKQKSVATSIIEAEYMTLSICVKEDLWISQVLKDMNLTKYLGISHSRVDILEKVTHQSVSPTQLKEDNQASLMLVKNAHIHERSKHIDVAYHHIRDLHKKNQISVNFVSSQDMVADGLIKPLPRQNFKRFIEQLRLKSSRSWGTRKHRVKVLRSAMAGLFLAAYCGGSGSSLDSVRLVSSSSL